VTDTPETNDCVHHWIIETPAGGPTSDARCRKCGTERAFSNFDEKFSGSYKTDPELKKVKHARAAKSTGNALGEYWRGDLDK